MIPFLSFNNGIDQETSIVVDIVEGLFITKFVTFPGAVKAYFFFNKNNRRQRSRLKPRIMSSISKCLSIIELHTQISFTYTIMINKTMKQCT